MEPTEKPVINTTIVMNQGDSAANLTHAPQIRLETPASNVKKAKKDVREAKAYQGQMKEFREIYDEVVKKNFKPPASWILSQDDSISYEFDKRAFYLQKFNEAVAAKEREKDEELSQQEPITEVQEHNEGPGTENDADQSGLDLEPELIGTLMSLGCSPEKAQELAALRGRIKREIEKANSQASIQDGVIPQEKAQHIENLLDRMRQAANERLKQLKSARHGS